MHEVNYSTTRHGRPVLPLSRNISVSRCSHTAGVADVQVVCVSYSTPVPSGGGQIESKVCPVCVSYSTPLVRHALTLRFILHSLESYMRHITFPEPTNDRLEQDTCQL
jgi:hypothetical protein